MKNFVRIQSQINITVTAGLQAIDATNYYSPQADRLNVKPGWVGFEVDIKQGLGYYPSEIVNWPTVKALAKSGKLTIGEEVDDFIETDEYPSMEEVLALKKKLKAEAEKYAKLCEQVKKTPTPVIQTGPTEA